MTINEKGEYDYNGGIPMWSNGKTIVKYRHQDDNFDNVCSSEYCRCKD